MANEPTVSLAAARSRERDPADAVAARHQQALRRDRGAHGRLVRGAPGRGARPARRERRRQVDPDERRVGRDRARRRHDRPRRRAASSTSRRRLAQELGIAIVHQHPALLPDMTVAENILVAVGREHLRRRDPDVREGDALAARRRPLRRAPRGPRLVAQRRPPAPARARQGLRRLAAAPDPRRADGAALAGLRRAALHRRPQARGGGHGGRLHHAPARRGARDRRSGHGPARRQAPRHVGRRGDLRRRPARHDHRAHARGDLPAEARARRRRGAAAAGRGAERTAASRTSRSARAGARSWASPASSATASRRSCARWPGASRATGSVNVGGKQTLAAGAARKAPPTCPPTA